MTTPDTLVRCAIEQNIASFAFRDLFHPQATISISWHRGPIKGFIEASRSIASPTKHWLSSDRTIAEYAREIWRTEPFLTK